MLIRLVQPGQLLAKRQMSLADVLAPFARAVEESPHDLKDVRVVFDWIQYKNSFRDAFVARRLVDEWDKPRSGAGEIAIDLRQVEPEQFAECFARAVHTLAQGNGDEGRLFLEEFKPGADSLMWAWNLFF